MKPIARPYARKFGVVPERRIASRKSLVQIMPARHARRRRSLTRDTPLIVTQIREKGPAADGRHRRGVAGFLAAAKDRARRNDCHCAQRLV